jgi:hypothetical protein
LLRKILAITTWSPATACADRIFHDLASIALRDMPGQAAEL